MNLLGLIFSIILILSFGTYACFEKQVTSSRLRASYLSHQRANRKILNSYQSKIYEQMRGKATNSHSKRNSELNENEDDDIVKLSTTSKENNRECARINLWPLIQEGREAHPELYELTAKLIGQFYPLQNSKKRFNYYFLDQLLKSSKLAVQENEQDFALEKVQLSDEELQKTYYYMLKGTKKWDLAKKSGYPSLLDYVKTTPNACKICVSHADLNLLSVLFNEKAASMLFETIHHKEKPALTNELIEHVCSKAHLMHLDPNLLNLLELGYPEHKETKKVFVSDDAKTGVFLRKNIPLKSPS